jgi:hypothetical protein
LGEVVGALSVGLGDHVQMPLQNHPGGVFTALSGGLFDPQVAKGVAVVGKAQTVCPGFKLGHQRRFVA